VRICGKKNHRVEYYLIYSIFELLVEKMNLKRAGYKTISLRLAEILFISIIRHFYLKQSKDQLNLFKDELVFNAIDLIHEKLGEEGSIEKLARQAGVTRTLFTEQF
jgi:transcriptional regulator GlxA family with amidase domain